MIIYDTDAYLLCELKTKVIFFPTDIDVPGNVIQ